MKKQFLVIFLAVMVVFLLAACGGGGTTSSSDTSATDNSSAASAPAPATTDSSGSTAKTFKVGINSWVAGNFALDSIAGMAAKSYEALGFDVIQVNDEANVDKSVSNVQNLLTQGVDLIDFWGINQSLILTVADMCAQKQTAFILRDAFPDDPDIVAQLKANPYFVGFCGGDNYQNGARMAQVIIDSGKYTKGIISGVDLGNSAQDGRCLGAQETFDKAGITVLGTARPNSTSTEEIQTQCEDLLTSHQDAQFWYSAFLDCVTAGQQTIDNLHLNLDVYVSDINPTSIDAIKQGKYKLINGYQWIAGVWNAALAYNYLTGHPIKDADGNPPIIKDIKMIVVDQNSVDLFNKFFMQDVPYDADYIKSLTYDVNPDNATYDHFVQECQACSLDTVLKMKEAQGLVTADELSKAGIS